MKKIIKKFGRVYMIFFELCYKCPLIPATVGAIILWFAWLVLLFKIK
jgi:hypothetical protein